MSIIQGNAKQASTRGFYNFPLEQSLRFNDDDTAYLSWTPASAGNRKTWTWSGWVKRSSIDSTNAYILFDASTSDTAAALIEFGKSTEGDNSLNVVSYQGSHNIRLRTSMRFRDVSSWYHIVVAMDTSQATASDRVNIYVNGTLQTDFQIETYPALNHEPYFNSTNQHHISKWHDNRRFFDGYLAEVNFIDGTALTADSFGELKNGVWIPKDPSGLTYGTNGFRLSFADDAEVEAFNTVLYRGNGGTQSVTGMGFQPDLVWIKQRSAPADNHRLFDSVRGATKYLVSDNVYTETTDASTLTSFDNDGFSLSSNGIVNENNLNFVAWGWKAGDSNVSNTDGTITSTVRANDTYGFSIVSYTGTGANATVGHGLSSAPDMIIIKSRTGGTNAWQVGHSSLAWTDYLGLNVTDAKATSVVAWNNTAPTSSVFSIGTRGACNASGENMIAYCWTETSGVSKFGTFTGNGSSTGPSVTTGFLPSIVIYKRIDAASDWWMIDSTRDTKAGNPSDVLFPNKADAELETSDWMLFTSTGFQLSGRTDSNTNGSGGTYIYAAFADTREAAFWLDQSGNDNDWQPVNLDHNDTVADSPTNNFATFNPIEAVSGGTRVLSDGNLSAAVTYGGNYPTARLTFLPTNVTGQFYWEVTIGSKTSTYYQLGFNIKSLVYSSGDLHTTYRSDGNLSNTLSGSWSGTGVSYTQGDVIGVAYDASNGEAKFYKNGTYVATWTPSSFPEGYNFGVFSSSATNNYTINCGQQPFKYDPPA